MPINKKYRKYFQYSFRFFILTLCHNLYAEDFSGSVQKAYSDQDVFIRIVERSKIQLHAFYTGRKFNSAAIKEILKTCYVTAIIHNTSSDVLWLDLNDWEFNQQGIAIQRIKRDYWPPLWQKTDLEKAHQSTFEWTLMPDLRDLRPDESVGGSVVIPAQNQPFDLTINLAIGSERPGSVKSVQFKGLECIKE